ncbi:MAG: Crp/Fnr family transcriptional regulator [Pseudomonadota bacterium]
MELVRKSDGDNPTPLVRKLAASVLLTPEEADYLEGLESNLVRLKRGECLFRDGEDIETAYLVVSGWFSRHRVTGTGRRQMIGITLPGDFLALRVTFEREMQFSAEALTDCEVAVIEPMRLIETYQRFPIIASGLDWSTVRTLNILGEHNVSLGARQATHRIAHFCLELWCRLALVNLAEEDGFAHPMTQEQLAATLGLSAVHTNKMLRELSDEGLLRWGRDFVRIDDLAALADYADFDVGFLDTFKVTANVPGAAAARNHASEGDGSSFERRLHRSTVAHQRG